MLTSIILQREDIRENDQRITLYTKERGLVMARAVGVKKVHSKQSSRLEPGVLAYAEVVRGYVGDKILTSEPLAVYPQVRRSYRKILCIQYILGLVAQVVKPEQPDPALFDFLKSVLEVYNRISDEQSGEILRRALWKLIEILGYEGGSGDLQQWHIFAEYNLERQVPNVCHAELISAST